MALPRAVARGTRRLADCGPGAATCRPRRHLDRSQRSGDVTGLRRDTRPPSGHSPRRTQRRAGSASVLGERSSRRAASQPSPTPQPGGTTPSRPSRVAMSQADLPRLEDELAPVAREDAARRLARRRRARRGGASAGGRGLDHRERGGDDGLGHLIEARGTGLTARRACPEYGRNPPAAARPRSRPMTEVAAEPTTYQLFIAGRWVDAVTGRDVREPSTRPTRATSSGGSRRAPPADVAMAIRAAEMATAALEGDAGAEARRDPVPLRRAHGRAQGAARAGDDPRDGQGPRRGARRRPGGHRHRVPHGRRGPPDVRRHGARPSCPTSGR